MAAVGRHRRRPGSLITLVACAAAVPCAAAVAGCGSSATTGSTTGAKAATASDVTATATVTTKHVAGYGTVLAAASGATVYLLSSDPPGGSRCTGTCTAQWHPLTVTSAPTAGPGVKASLLSTFARGNGTRQVTYDDHALYTYSEPGASAGAGLAADGGVWYLVSAAGGAVKTIAGGY